MNPPDRAERLRIVVFGLAASLPVAGLTAHYLQYVLGLRALGHDVLYVEDTGWYYDPWRNVYVDEWNGNRVPERHLPARRLAATMRRYGLERHWTWIDIDGTEHGVAGSRLRRFLADADLLIHVTGAGRMRDEYLEIPKRAYLDTDPGYVQMRTARYGHEADLQLLAQHTAHFTFARNIQSPDCTIPQLGYDWQPTHQPIVIRLWPGNRPVPDGAPFTTVLKWSPYEAIEFEGVVYGMKDVEFEKFVDLPATVCGELELAMEGTPPVAESELRRRGWRIADGPAATARLSTYRSYIASSCGEWSVAKHGYVATRSGWFSDRSASYLAMGRPVVLQSTGYETWLPVGEGLVSFSTLDEARAAVDDVLSRPTMHRARARELAVEHFDAGTVLSTLVEQATS